MTYVYASRMGKTEKLIEKLAIDAMKIENGTETVKPPMLIINEIPEERRIEDREILREAIAEGKRAEKEGRYFHPAANGKIDDCTDGYSSLIQLRGLIANMKVAETL